MVKRNHFPRRGDPVKRKADGVVGQIHASDPQRDILTVLWRTASGSETQVCTSENLFHDWEWTDKSAKRWLTTHPRIVAALVVIIGGSIGIGLGKFSDTHEKREFCPTLRITYSK
jgi:hypothetical protein